MDTYRALTPGEIAALEASGSTADDWSSIEVAEDFHPRNCAAHGWAAVSGSHRACASATPASATTTSAQERSSKRSSAWNAAAKALSETARRWPS
ncbi:MAG: hypothetical protein ACLSHL_03790 [Alistipes communis]